MAYSTIDEVIKIAQEVCLKNCDDYKAYKKHKNIIGLRSKCMHCKRNNRGIYKADIVLSLILKVAENIDLIERIKELEAEIKELEEKIEELEKSKFKPNTGKKATYKDRYKKAVEEHIKSGKSQNAIAKLLKIDPKSVRNIMKANNIVKPVKEKQSKK